MRQAFGRAPAGTVDPARDVDIIDTELVLSDGQTLENALVRLQCA